MKPEVSLNELMHALPTYDTEALSVVQAKALIQQFVQANHHEQQVEEVELHAALGRVLAHDIISGIDVPAHDNSAMDGYAFRHADLIPEKNSTLRIVASQFAGQHSKVEVGSAECVRIMTGAIMPAGCDTVIPQEWVLTENAAEIIVPANKLRAGDNRRLAGEDLARGKPALRQGKILQAADVGLAASLGIARLPVQTRLRVAIFSTGNELQTPGDTLNLGQVYDSNRYTLHAMLSKTGCEVIDMGIVPDDPTALETALRSASEQADAIISSGGVSVGDADYTKQMMAKLGEVAFWKLAMRPGRPMAFGKIRSDGRSAILFGLPGNPVAVMISYYFFVRDALLHMMAAQAPTLMLIPAVSADAIRKRAGRTEYQRGILSRNTQGQLHVRMTGSQGSGILRSMSEANCIVVLAHAQGTIAAGEMVEVLPFEGLL